MRSLTGQIISTWPYTEAERVRRATAYRLEAEAKRAEAEAAGRGLHSSTLQLNLSAFCRIGVHSGAV
jgi:hypothetical protein